MTKRTKSYKKAGWDKIRPQLVPQSEVCFAHTLTEFHIQTFERLLRRLSKHSNLRLDYIKAILVCFFVTYRTKAIRKSRATPVEKSQVTRTWGFCLDLVRFVVIGNWDEMSEVDSRCTRLYTHLLRVHWIWFSHARVESTVMKSEAVIRQNYIINRRGLWQQG